jgi:hypothetical protein
MHHAGPVALAFFSVPHVIVIVIVTTHHAKMGHSSVWSHAPQQHLI